MKKFIFLSFIFISSVSGHALADSLEDILQRGKVVARLGTLEIHEGYIELLQRVNPKMKTQTQNPAERKRLLENIIEQELFYQESKKLGLDRQESVTEKIEIYGRVITAQALVDHEIQKKAQDYYKSHSSEFKDMTFEDAYPKISESLKKETKERLLKKLKGKAKIEYLD